MEEVSEQTMDKELAMVEETVSDRGLTATLVAIDAGWVLEGPVAGWAIILMGRTLYSERRW